MRYQQSSFSVPGSAGSKAECDRVGHTQPDAHGKCLRCAERVKPTGRGAAGDSTDGQGVAAASGAIRPVSTENPEVDSASLEARNAPSNSQERPGSTRAYAVLR